MTDRSPCARRNLRVIIGSLEVGGAEYHLAQALPALERRGWSVRVATLSSGGSLVPVLEKAGVSVCQLGKRGATGRGRSRAYAGRLQSLLELAAGLGREFRRVPADLTWFVLPEAYLLGVIVAIVARLREPLVMSRRSLNNYQHKYPGSRWLERRFHKRLSLVLANSEAVARQLHDEEGVSASLLRIVHNGVDPGRFACPAPRARMRESLGISPDGLAMVVVANLIPYKGHADLLRALHLARHRLTPDWRLLCVGKMTAYGETLKRLASDLGIAGHVSWLGIRHDIPDLLGACDIGLLASHEEGFSNAILEGMASGLAMIVTDVGGNAEAVIHQASGLVVPAHSPAALSDAIAELAMDENKRRKFGARGRERIVHDFSLAACVDRYDKLFAAVADGTALPSRADLARCRSFDSGEAESTRYAG